MTLCPGVAYACALHGDIVDIKLREAQVTPWAFVDIKMSLTKKSKSLENQSSRFATEGCMCIGIYRNVNTYENETKPSHLS